ncbi:MAG: hypothetical protein K0Q55_1316 [Verrucomicrobia bacterium]|jgi:tetratricopeptide (TPR) repeat protein|nr:hypothetical protein [Verrucomicrobiota bacterium]
MMYPRKPSASEAKCWLLLAGVLCLVWLTFSPAVNFELLAWDDDINLQNNPHLTGLSLASLKWMFTDLTYQWRYQPLAWLTWFTLFEIQGLDPFGYHLINLLFHLGNTARVFVIARRLLASLKGGETGAVLAAAIWSLHPMRVETVAWAVELLYQQALFFMLLSLLAYLKAYQASEVNRRWLVTSVVAFACSLFTFPLALGFVAVLLLADIYLLKRLSGSLWQSLKDQRFWMEKAPFIVLTLVAAGMNFACRANATKLFGAPASLEAFGVFPRMMQAFYMWGYYLWKPLWPVGLTPIPTPLIEFNPLGAVFLLSAIGVVAGTWLLYQRRARHPALWTVWLVHLAMLVPVLGLTEHPHFPNDRYSLVIGVGWSILLAGAWTQWLEKVRWRVIPASVALAVVTALAVASAVQLPFWANNHSFFPHVIAQLKDHPFRFGPLTRMAHVHRQEFLRAEADEYLVQALEIQPQAVALRTTLADSQVSLGKRDEARRNYLRITEDAPKTPAIHARLAKLYLDEGNYLAAAEELGREMQLAPGNPVLELQYGLALARAGSINAAERHFAQMGEQGKLKGEDVFKCQLALADGFALKDDLLTAVEIAGEVKKRAEAVRATRSAQEADMRLKRWVPILLKNDTKK